MIDEENGIVEVEPTDEPEEATEEEYNEYIKNAQVVKQSRWQSKVLWLSVAAVIAFVMGNWGLYEKVGLTNESFQNLVNLVLSALAAMGIINDATTKNKW